MKIGQEKCTDCGKPASRYQIIPGPPRQVICHACQVHPVLPNITTFPFTTSHITGKPVEVSSLRQLRRLESQFGVSSVAYNMDSKNAEPPQQRDFAERIAMRR